MSWLYKKMSVKNTKYAFENYFRTPFEFNIAVLALLFSILIVTYQSWFSLDQPFPVFISCGLFCYALIKALKGIEIVLFQKRLLKLESFFMTTSEVPISNKNLYIGHGFRWKPIHRQRLHLLSLLENQKYSQFKNESPVGGKPWIHGVGSQKEKAVFLSQANRNSHECIFGMTRVGKTRFLSIKVNQDIRNGEAVLVIDPKGDFDVLQDMYCAVKAAGRMDDFIVAHFGFPEYSAKYNPLSSFSNVSEVASRVTSVIGQSGEGKTFKDFAWQYVNIVAVCLYELKEPINYKTITFYIKRPEILLAKYMDKIFPMLDKNYEKDIQEIIDENDSRVDRQGNFVEALPRSSAIKRYLKQYIEKHINDNTSELMDSVIVPLYNAAALDKTYYDKITASVGPVLDKINQTQAQSIFSFGDVDPLHVIQLENVILKKQIVYIGLDSLTNQSMAEAVGQAIIADLVSLCGRNYTKNNAAQSSLCLHCDEFSNIVQDEFINLLNKAGGAGIKVCAYTQTINDLGAVFGTNHDKPKMLLGNFGTISMLRVANEDTATVFTRCVESVKVRSVLPITQSSDLSKNQHKELFTTQNTDQIQEESRPIVEINDLFSLPKGQAFVMTNGGEIYKIRIPLPKNDGTAPNSFIDILKEVNQCA